MNEEEKEAKKWRARTKVLGIVYTATGIAVIVYHVWAWINDVCPFTLVPKYPHDGSPKVLLLAAIVGVGAMFLGMGFLSILALANLLPSRKPRLAVKVFEL